MTRHCFYIPNKTIKETLIHCISIKENIVNCDRERVGKGVSIFQNRISLRQTRNVHNLFEKQNYLRLEYISNKTCRKITKEINIIDNVYNNGNL